MRLTVRIWSFIPLMLRLDKAVQLYQSTNMELERNFEKLIAGVNENFKKRNISLLEFIDYYDSYKETCIQLHEIKKECFPGRWKLNTTYRTNYIELLIFINYQRL